MKYNDGILELLVESKNDQNGICDAESKKVGYTIKIEFDKDPTQVMATQRNHIGKMWEEKYSVR